MPATQYALVNDWHRDVSGVTGLWDRFG